MPSAEEHFKAALASRQFIEMLKRHNLQIKEESGSCVSLHCTGADPIVRIMLAGSGARAAHIIPLHFGSWRDEKAIESMAKAEAAAKILSRVLPREIKVVIPAK